MTAIKPVEEVIKTVERNIETVEKKIETVEAAIKTVEHQIVGATSGKCTCTLCPRELWNSED